MSKLKKWTYLKCSFVTENGIETALLDFYEFQFVKSTKYRGYKNTLENQRLFDEAMANGIKRWQTKQEL